MKQLATLVVARPFRNLDADTQARDAQDDSDYSPNWMTGQIGHHIHDPYEL